MPINAVNFDYGSTAVTISAQAPATLNQPDQVNEAHRGLKVAIDITAIGASTNLTVTIQGKDKVSGKYYTVLVSAVLAAVSTTVLTVYPGITTTANVAASDVLPGTWRIQAVVAGTNTVTATIGVSKLA